MNYRKCAEEIYAAVGKRENLVSAAHCATRLRLVTNDNSKVDMETLENIEGVKGVFSSNGQLQIIIGTEALKKMADFVAPANDQDGIRKAFEKYNLF